MKKEDLFSEPTPDKPRKQGLGLEENKDFGFLKTLHKTLFESKNQSEEEDEAPAKAPA